MSKYRKLNVDVIINGETKRIDSQIRTEFVKRYRLDELIPNRYSEVLIVDLIVNAELNQVDPNLIIDEIRSLESLDENSYTKNATQFRRPPLCPLWHKHYFSSHFIGHNLYNEFNKNFKNMWDDAMGEEGSLIEQKHLDKLVHNLVEGAIEKRSEEKQITGEWLIFSRQNSGNVYLCVATHTTGDDNIYKKIEYCCEHQFPSLEPFASNRRQAKTTS